MSEAAEIEAKAKAMGWSPKEQWRGEPDKFVDAETFVQRGEEFIPFLKANNRKLEAELGEVKGKLTKQEQLLQNAAESMEELKKFNTSVARERAEDRKEELKTALKKAREDGDVDAEVEINEQLAATSAALKEANKTKEKPTTFKIEPAAGENPTNAYMQTEEWKGWTQDNPWFGADKKKTALSMGIAEELRSQPNPPKGRAFLDAVSAEVEKFFDGGERQTTKVDSGSSGGNSGGGGGPRGKRFADLPEDAKAACDKQALKLVGEGRTFKTKAEWQTYYVNKYFEEA